MPAAPPPGPQLHLVPPPAPPAPRLALVPAPTAIEPALAATRPPRLHLVAPAAAPRPRPVPRLAAESGQASVELVAALPLIVAILALVYQALLAGQAVWEVRVASRAAARANAFGGDAADAARAHLSAKLERGLRVHAGDDG